MRPTLLLAAALCLASSARAAERPRGWEPLRSPDRPAKRKPAPKPVSERAYEVAETRRPWVEARARAWFLRSRSVTRTEKHDDRFIPSDASLEGDDWDSQLVSVMPVAELEVAPLSWLSVLAEYGSSVSRGQVLLHNWLDATPGVTLTHTGNGNTFESPQEAETGYWSTRAEGRTDWASASLALRVLDAGFSDDEEDRSTGDALDVLLGAHLYQEDVAINDIRMERADTRIPSVFAPGLYRPGAAGRRRVVWKGPHLGLRNELRLPWGFAFEPTVLWSPFMLFVGDSFDIAHADVQDRAHGWALHARASARWRWGPVGLEGGYQRLGFWSRPGNTREVNAQGVVLEKRMPYNRTEVSGFFAGASFSF